MGKTMLEQIKEAKKDHELAIVSYFNNGDYKSDEYYIAKNINERIGKDHQLILETLKDATSSYAFLRNFDTINMQMLFGLIYDIKDVDENFNIKDGSEPMKDVVRYYTYKIESYLDGEMNSPYSYYEHRPGRQGFVNYNEFVQYLKDEGLIYDGPETFEELKNKILANEVFDVNITANILEKSEDKEIASGMKLVRK